MKYNKSKINQIIHKALDIEITPKNIVTPLVQMDIDSLYILDLVCELENELDIKIPDEDYKGIKTIVDVYKMLDQYPF